MINIKGGTFVLDGQNGDPLDSNGKMTMTDGTVVIHGLSGAEVIDYKGTFVVTKGFIIGTVGSANSRMFQAPSTNSTVITDFTNAINELKSHVAARNQAVTEFLK